MNDKPLFTEADIIFCYSRAEGIADGALRDITGLAKDARFRFPVAITAAAWVAAIEPPGDCPEQSVIGRTWDVLQVLRSAAQQLGGDSHSVNFTVQVRQSADRTGAIALKATCHPGDKGEPVISIMLPHED